jgi:hypothetical protein
MACDYLTVKEPLLILPFFSRTGKKNGITHAFVVEFENVEDRDYYVQHDPAHRAFVQSLDGVMEKVQVIDFSNGVFK